MKRALITGVGGQDGSFLAEHLLKLGYEVHGIARGMVYEFVPKPVVLHVADVRDGVAIENIFRKVWPDEVYNLAGQVFVPTSWSKPEETFDVNVGGLTRLLKCVSDLRPETRVYQASSSEMYGNQLGCLNEQTAMKPTSPYGASKYAAHVLCDVYRQKGLHVCAGILFNHEGTRRGGHMVTRKITRHVARWATGDVKAVLQLGSMLAARDWGNAQDYVEAMHLMLQHHIADDYVIGTGESHTVKDFLDAAMEAAGLQWEDFQHLVKSDTKAFSRVGEIWQLKADYTKAKTVLGWKPKTSFAELVTLMVSNDIKEIRERERLYSTVPA